MLKKAAARVAGTAEPGVAPSVACGVAAAFTGQLVAFPLEAIARRMQARPTLYRVSASRVALVCCRHCLPAGGHRAAHAGAPHPIQGFSVQGCVGVLPSLPSRWRPLHGACRRAPPCQGFSVGGLPGSAPLEAPARRMQGAPYVNPALPFNLQAPCGSLLMSQLTFI